MAKIGMAEITKTTCDFYSRFCGTDLLSAGHGVRFVCSEERDRVLKGYGRKYTIYILLKGKDCFAAFSPKYRALFDERKACADIDGCGLCIV